MPRRPLGYPMPPVCGFFSTSLQRQPWPSFLLLFSCFHTESQLPRGFSAQEISHSKGSHSVEPPGPPGKAVVWISTPVWHKDTWQPRVLSALWLHEVSKIQRGSKGWRLSGREWADTVYTRRGQDQKWEGQKKKKKKVGRSSCLALALEWHSHVSLDSSHRFAVVALGAPADVWASLHLLLDKRHDAESR